MSALHDLTALEQAAAIRRREVSPVELAEHYLRRAERLSDTVGAYVTLTPDLALRQARAAERAVVEAADPRLLPVLHGVPVPVKDLTAVAGVRMRSGSAAVDMIPAYDDNVVIRLRAGGTVCLGKTNTPEFGLPCYTESEVGPPARTPWDLRRSAGGSSGGAASAVAAGLAPLAHGSDGGGSIRTPASACGLVGLKPSRGRISTGPLGDAVGELGTSGPLARTVRDAAALLDVLAGAFPGDPVVAPPLPPGETFLAHAERAPERLRIGRYRAPVLAPAEVADECLAAYEAASMALSAVGHDVEDVDRPFGFDMVPCFETVWSVLARLPSVPPAAEVSLLPLTRWLRDRGRRVSGLELAVAVATMRLQTRHTVAAMSAYDAVLTPTLAQPPALVGALRDDADPARDFANQKAFSPFTASYNVSGQPAISLPLHRTADGLPIGVQLAGRPFEEALLVALAAQLEAAHPWAGLTPPLW